MSDEIVNRVSSSDLITIDLVDYSPSITILEFDLKDFLFNGEILKEKEFRSQLKKFDFSVFSNTVVAVCCSSDAIVPMWAFMLISSYLNSVSSKFYFGKKEQVFQILFLQNIESIDTSEFESKKVIIKGCGSIKISEEHYITISKKLLPYVDSLMFGEACSAVPVFKKI
jgi:hypothetical protein